VSGPGKGLLVILDGLGDRPNAVLRGLTPLGAASLPFLDRLARSGMCALTDPLSPGVPVDTPTGTGVLFGVPPDQIRSLARGPVEAAGVGLELQPGDVAVRCNFATVRRNGDGSFTILDRRAGRIREGTDDLAAALADLDLGEGVTASLKPASQHRAVVRLSGPELEPSFTNTDPGGSRIPDTAVTSRPIQPERPGSRRGAMAVNRLLEVAYERLNDHPVNRDRAARGLPPANGLITRGAGAVSRIDSLLHELGIGAAVVAGERTVIGLARLLGFHVETRPEFTGMPDTDVAGKVSVALDLLDRHDLVFLHVKAPDIYAHDRSPDGKAEFLERTDRALARLPTEGLVLGVCGDHCTDASTGNHCGDPVPALLHGPGLDPDACTTFDEVGCAAGSLGRIPAATYLSTFVQAMRGFSAGATDQASPTR
jgi:2,3-bisphosphoglycerate-independent phosphoglycerate mutase